MEPQGSKAFRRFWRGNETEIGPEEDHARIEGDRSNSWAECREKKLGTEPKGKMFLLTFLYIGQFGWLQAPATTIFFPIRNFRETRNHPN